MPPLKQRTRHRSWSGSLAKPTPVRQKGRKETAPCQASRGRRGRWWPQCAISAQSVPTAAVCCWLRLVPTLAQPNGLRQVPTPPTCPRGLSRPAPRRVQMRRRQSSRPVGVTCTKNTGRRDTGFRHCLAVPDSLKPCSYRWLRRDALQLSTQELLHGLALQCCPRGEFVANFLGDTPYRYLYRHDRIMPL